MNRLWQYFVRMLFVLFPYSFGIIYNKLYSPLIPVLYISLLIASFLILCYFWQPNVWCTLLLDNWLCLCLWCLYLPSSWQFYFLVPWWCVFFMTNCTLGCQRVFLTGIQPAWSCFSLISYSLQLCHSKVCCVFPPSFHTIRSVRENICLFGLPKLIFLTNYKWQFFGKISEQMNKIKCYRKKVD